MKTCAPAVAFPQRPAAILLLCALAFLPSLLHLASQNFNVTHPAAVVGPVIAGFWFASTLREIRVPFVLLGALVTVLLWSANLLMTAGQGCCSTP